ncbi:MAG: hypothetical protein Q9210_002897 [Variospora velana]
MQWLAQSLAMGDQRINAAFVGVVVVLLSLLVHHSQSAQPQMSYPNVTSAELSAASVTLAKGLPDSVFFGPHPVFIESVQSYWAMQERDIVPQCIVRPRNAREVATAIGIIKRDYDLRTRRGDLPSPFAIRSGGHSPIPGAANTNRGIVIDLRLLNQVVPSRDGLSVVIGSGARWLDVSSALDSKSLAVAGGRNSAVGVGGLTLGGGISFFSPRVGFVCNNILSYEIVLADGTIATASESSNPGLWRALKGGSNNFGVVTSFVARSFPSTSIWSGFLYMTGSKAKQVIDAFHEFNQAKSGIYDEYAGGPLVCFSFLQKLGINVVSTHLAYTKPFQVYWQIMEYGQDTFSHQRDRRVGQTQSTWVAVRVALLPAWVIFPADSLYRDLFFTTTVKNDHATLMETYAAYKQGAEAMRRVKGMIWTLTLQPLLPAMMRKGQPDSQGLGTRTEPLVIVLFTVVWKDTADDELVDRTTRGIIRHIDQYAASRGTADLYRYLNDCASWQRPFDGYGAENKRFLQNMSRVYDPNGLFQRACVGGFKLDMDRALLLQSDIANAIRQSTNSDTGSQS